MAVNLVRLGDETASAASSVVASLPQEKAPEVAPPKPALAVPVPETPPSPTAQLHTAETVGIVTIILISLIAVGLWLWMARANGAGKSWARIVALVFFILSTLSLARSVFEPNAVGSKIFAILTWLVGLAATVFLWQKDSSEFFAVSSNRGR